VVKVRLPLIWQQLPDTDRAHLAHVIAVLVRRLSQRPDGTHEPA
jgi:hypothetical protein